jgi:hypothetical protein
LFSGCKAQVDAANSKFGNCVAEEEVVRDCFHNFYILVVVEGQKFCAAQVGRYWWSWMLFFEFLNPLEKGSDGRV